MISKTRTIISLMIPVLLSSNLPVSAEDRLIRIETPNGSPVTCTWRCDEASEDQLSIWHGQCESYISNGLDAIIIGEASRKYNCHGYAWHFTVEGEEVWMGAYAQGTECPSLPDAELAEDIYWTDGSYYEVTGVEPANVTDAQVAMVNWPRSTADGGNHSAITTESEGYLISKWGNWPLVRHWWADSPYDERGMKLYNRLDPNLAVGFEGAWAFHGEDGLVHVAWVSDSERGSKAFEIYGGNDPHDLIQTIPAEGHPKWPHYYELVINSVERSFQVLEVDEQDQRLCGTRIFTLGDPPSMLASLRVLNDSVANWPIRNKVLPSEGSASHKSRESVLSDFIFYSSRQDFLNEVLPVSDKLQEQQGLTSQFILGSPDPLDCWAEAKAVYQLALDEGCGRLPFLVILGEANEDPGADENIVGMVYSPDSTGSCYWGDCASDAQIVDFDGDGLPDMPWSRVVASNLSEFEHCVQTALDYFEGDYLSDTACLLLDGDLGISCDPLPQPRAALEDIAEMFRIAGIPVTELHDSEFSDCDDFQERLDAGVAEIESGISELVGIGRTTNRSILPGYIFQKVYEPEFSIDLLPTPQRILVEFPGCGLGDGDRSNPNYYPSIMKMFLCADPEDHCTAVAWLAHIRGGFQSEHLPFARRYFEKRFSGQYRFVQEAYLEAIREMGQERPQLIDYLQCAGSFGWPMRIGSHPISVPEEIPGHSNKLSLKTYPNPANPGVTVLLSFLKPTKVDLLVFDIKGRKICTLLEGKHCRAGDLELKWDGTDARGRRLASGIYFVQMRSGRESVSHSLVLLK
jgi:hypothetical protein